MNSRKTNNSLFYNIINALSANFIVALVGLVNSFVFPKILSIADYAYYHTFTLYIGYLGILHLGFPTGMSINYAGKEYDTIDKAKYKSEVCILSVILTMFTVIFGFAYLITKNPMVLYIALVIIPVCTVASCKSLLQAWNRFKDFSSLSIFTSVCVPVISLLFFFLTGNLSGHMYIIVYISVNWLATCYIIIKTFKDISHVSVKNVNWTDNWRTEKIGFGILMGNYINVLLTSADKQFVSWFFEDDSFAFYSFGMSMQALMTVFIGSIAQPLFPKMARDDFDNSQYNEIKDLLLIFGSLSGIAYYGAAFIVKWFIPKYVESLNVVSIYFVVFPVLAVVSCLYINLYKIKELTKQYIKTLVFVLIIDIILNALLIISFKNYVMVALATSFVYFAWFLIGFKQFGFLQFSKKNKVFLILYVIGFFSITRIENDIVGCLVYFIYICLLISIIYKKYVNDILLYFKKK